MERIINLIFIIFYLTPLTVVVFNDRGFYANACILFLILAYVAGKSVYHPKCRPVNYSFLLIEKSRSFVVLALLYFILNREIILGIAENIYQGSFGAWAIQKAIDRYEEIAIVTFFQQVSTIIFIYYCTILGHSRITVLSLTVLFLMIFVESASLARASVVFGMAAFGTGYIISRSLDFQNLPIKKLIFNFVIVISLLLAVFGYSAVMRLQNGTAEDIVGIFFEKLQSYTIAIYDALLIWAPNAGIGPEGMGYDSLTFLYKLFGVSIPGGFYDLVTTKYGDTNVFTIIRGLLYDFGLLGTSFLIFIFSFGVKWFTYRSAGWISFSMGRCMIFAFLSIVVSPFMFTTVTVGFVLGGVHILLLSGRLTGQPLKKNDEQPNYDFDCLSTKPEN